MDTIYTLSDELTDIIITFVDGFGETIGTFDFFEDKPYFHGNITNDTEVKLINKSTTSKYNKMLNIYNNYYYGEYNNEQYDNIMCKIFKITFKHHIFSEKNEYILLIIDNPYYNSESEDISKKGKYKLIIYNICRSGVYYKYLTDIGIYTSLT